MIDRFIHSFRLATYAAATTLLLPLAACQQSTDQQARPTNTSAPAASAPSEKAGAPAVVPATNTVPPSTDQPLSMPFYPEEAKKRKEEGSVVLQLRVRSDGSIETAEVAQSSGFPQLDEYAVREALRNWRLKPGTVNGQPTPMAHLIKVTFKLD